MPWYSLKPRVVPLLLERDILPKSIVAAGEGATLPEFNAERLRDVACVFVEEKIKLSAPAADSKFPLVANPNAQGRASSFTIDFGRMEVGRPVLEIKGAKGGEIVDIMMSETVNEDGNTPISTVCQSYFANRLICREGIQTHDFFPCRRR